MILTCTICQGEGSIYASRCGGNDPDVYRVGPCDDCGGSGNMMCEARGCDQTAVAFNDDGEALCEDCLMEWALDGFDLGDDT